MSFTKNSRASFRTALVTGASRGIGKAISDQLKEDGIHVICPRRDEMDLSSLDSVRSWLNNNHESIDILVNNAGENPVALLEKITEASWDRTFDVNLTAPMLLIQHFTREMKRRNWGRIINISSCYSLVAREGRAPYSASKAALNALTRAVALEYGNDGILVNSVCPGFVDTDLTQKNNSSEQLKELAGKIPLNRLAHPFEIANLVSFLASEKNTYITGQTIAIDGGFTIQ
jgi:3-oxoacyl-[acyl-carrier protein] reductase